MLHMWTTFDESIEASVTKVMSLLLIMEQIDSGKLSLSDKIPFSCRFSLLFRSLLFHISLNFSQYYHLVAIIKKKEKSKRKKKKYYV